jgi:murein hydrolase activator
MSVLVIGCCSLLFAKNTRKPIAATPSLSVDYQKKIEEKNVAIDSIKAELEKGRKKLRELQSQEGTVAGQIGQLEQNIKLSERYLDRMAVKIDSTGRSITRLHTSLDSATLELAGRQEKMKRRLRSIYKTGQLELPQVVLSSRNMSDMLHRVRYFQELNRYDRTLLAAIETARTKIATDKAALEMEQKRLSGLKRAKESEHSSLVTEQASHEKLLGEVRSRKDAYVKMIHELEAAQKELKSIVAMLEKKRRAKVRTPYEKSLNATFEKRKGSLPWPVNGAVVTDFGKVIHSVYKTVTMNTGIDINARKGETVYCVASGKVVYVGWMRGLGKIVIVDHGGYYTTYARLEETLASKDDNVGSGAALGTVGEVNPFEGPKLHFEIRKSAEAMDPLDWLERKVKE